MAQTQLWLQNAKEIIRNRSSAPDSATHIGPHAAVRALNRKTHLIPLSAQTLPKCNTGYGETLAVD
jgi:hypothetical protein